jgi:hypothetical protein
MRATAWELEAIEALLPERGNKSRKQQLLHAAGRLSAAADLLTAEMQALSPKTVGRVARIGRLALFGAGALVGSIAGGVGEAGGQHLLERFEHRRSSAVASIEEVEREAPVGVQQIEESIDAALAEVAERLRQIASASPMNRHPAHQTVAEATETRLGAERPSRREYLNGLSDTARKMVGFMGPLEEWDEVVRDAGIETRDATESQWDRLVEIDVMLRSLEDD